MITTRQKQAEEDKGKMFRMFDRGCTNDQVKALLHCSDAKVKRARKSWREICNPPRKYGANCKGCYYWCSTTGVHTCDYILITGHSRQCDAENCEKKITEKEGKKLYGMSRQSSMLLTGKKK